MALEGQVTVPGGGKVSKKAAGAGLAITGGLIIWYYVRKHQQAATAAAAPAGTSTDQYPPDGTTGNPADPYSTDPATGQTYGNEAAGSGGTFGAFSDTGTGAGGTGTGDGGGGTGGPPFSTDSDWSQYVVQQEQSLNPDVNTSAMLDALGAYLEGQPVTAAQKTLVFDAIAIGGDPPVAGPSGYPPKVRTTGNGGGSTETVPGVTGKDADAALAALKAAHLDGKLSEDRKPGLTYLVTAQAPAAGRRVPEGSTVRLTIRHDTGGGKVKVPVTFGDRADTAVSKISSAGLKAVTAPPRRRGFSYWSYGSQPEGGTSVDKGTTVTITVGEGPPGTNIPQAKRT